MKRLVSALLAALLALGALGASALDYTLDEKLFKQVKDGSGLKAALSFEKTGGAFSVLDPAANAALSALLPGGELSLRYLRGVGTLKGMQELELTLKKAGGLLADLRLLQGPQFEQLSSSLFGVGRYVDVRDGGALGALLTGQDPSWPPLEGVLLKLFTAESTWQAAAAKKLEAYSVRLSLWLQGFTKTETVRGADLQLQTRVTLAVPAAQLKAEIKQLLLDMYTDPELLALLAQELDVREAAAYLQPGMMNGFFQALDLLPLTGNMVSERLMDTKGELLVNRLTLPLGGARGIRQVDYEYQVQPDGGTTALTVSYEPKNAALIRGAVTSLILQDGETAETGEMSYTGTLSLQPEPDSDAFTVDTAEGDIPAAVYAFNLLYTPYDEVVDTAAGSSTRDFELDLLITPQGQDAPAAQQVQANVRLQSRSNSRSATYFTGDITWQDQGSGAKIALKVQGNTAPPWAIPAVDPEGAVRVDSLSAAQLRGLSEQVRATFQNALAATLLKLAVPTVQP